jgi:hypothetical protein
MSDEKDAGGQGPVGGNQDVSLFGGSFNQPKFQPELYVKGTVSLTGSGIANVSA